MAYDEGLAERLRALVDERRGVAEKAMFGGLCFLRDGKMFIAQILRRKNLVGRNIFDKK